MKRAQLTVTDIAERLDTCETTVRRWIKDGRMKATIRCKREGYIVAWEDYVAFMKENPKYAKRY